MKIVEKSYKFVKKNLRNAKSIEKYQSQTNIIKWRIQHLDQEIADLVYQLYGLEASEIALIENENAWKILIKVAIVFPFSCFSVFC